MKTTWIVAIIALSASPVGATIFDVPTGPYPHIQSGIDAASPGDSVRVAPGTYFGAGNRDIDYGGKDIVVFSSGGSAVTVIDNAQVSRGFHFHSNESNAAVLDGFTITNGNPATFAGNAILVLGSAPTIKNCFITLNTVTGFNPVVACYSGFPVFIGCTVEDNTADNWVVEIGRGTWDQCSVSGNNGSGAVVYNATIQNTAFVGNTEDGATASIGSVFQNCEFSWNGDDGVEIVGNESGDATLVDCLMESNQSTGVFVDSGSPSLTNCTIQWNGQSRAAVAGVYLLGDSPTLTNCVVQGNLGTAAGGIAIHNGSILTTAHSPVLDGCTITGNVTNGGGGGVAINAQIQGGALTTLITGCTIADNDANGSGGGIQQTGVVISGPYETTITKSIVWNNCATFHADVNIDCGLANIDCSIIGPDSGGLINTIADVSNDDPLFCGSLPPCDFAPTISGNYAVDWCSYAVKNPCGVTIGSQPQGCSGGLLTNVVNHGDMEGFFATVGSNSIPSGWTEFITNPSEISLIIQNASNGPTLPGNSSVTFRHFDSGNGSIDWVAIDQALDFWPVPACSTLTLSLDVLINFHTLVGGGISAAPFEWPATVVIDYEDTFGVTQTWRWGWYITPPGGGSPQPNETEIPPSQWWAHSFDLFSELGPIKRLTNIRIGGAGLNLQSTFDNVQILCDGCPLTATAIGDTPVTPPSAKIALSPAAPNPFAGQSSFTVTAPQGEKVTVAIYDVLGRRVREIANETIPSGTAFFTWDGRNDRGARVASGVYFYRASSSVGHATKRMVLIR